MSDLDFIYFSKIEVNAFFLNNFYTYEFIQHEDLYINRSNKGT